MSHYSLINHSRAPSTICFSLLLVGAVVFTVRGSDDTTTPVAEVVVEESAAGQQQQQSPIAEAIVQEKTHHRRPSVEEVELAAKAASEIHSPKEAVELATTESEQHEAEKNGHGSVSARIPFKKIYSILH
ncbi:unnamed protein product [Gongylonema pulchrum]|uniref:Secreted protein n=1 Tax=Gongylonema pulchrum TaxID=637853 RepID=A0A183DGF2_9BILA|nr:unnamed protein product [Gongylonema pulchrum]